METFAAIIILFGSAALVPMLLIPARLIMRRKSATRRSWYTAYGLALLLASALVPMHYYASLLEFLLLFVLITIVKLSGNDSWDNRSTVYGLCFLWPLALAIIFFTISSTGFAKLWYLFAAVAFSLPFPLILAMRYSPPPEAP